MMQMLSYKGWWKLILCAIELQVVKIFCATKEEVMEILCASNVQGDWKIFS